MADVPIKSRECSLCFKMTQNYIYLGPTHDYPLCVDECLPTYEAVLELRAEAYENG